MTRYLHKVDMDGVADVVGPLWGCHQGKKNGSTEILRSINSNLSIRDFIRLSRCIQTP